MCLGRLLGSDKKRYLKMSRIILKFIGIWSDEGSTIVYRIICGVNLIVCLAVGVITFLWPPDEDVLTFGVTIMVTAAAFSNIIKIVWYSYNADKIGWLLNELERITKENFLKEKSHRIEFIEASNIPDLLTILLIFMIIIIFGLETLYRVFITSDEYSVMFNFYSFIDPARYYFLAFLFQYFYIIWTGAGVIINFNLLLSLTMLIVANISVLEKYLKSSPTEISRTVNLHTDILRYVRVVNEVLQPAIISDLASSSIITCMCAYMCVKGTTMQHKTIAYIMMCTEGLIPWFICYCGSVLEEKSKKLVDAVYSSRWIELKPKQRKEINILMIATSRPLQFKISRAHIINFTYYTNFIQVTYSFFALLLSLEE